MKILLLGEYSRLHNSLKEGLIQNGHEVFLAGFGDSFKDYPVDFKFNLGHQSGIKKLVRKGIRRLLGIDLQSRDIRKQFFSNQSLFKGYDVVQLINEQTFKTISEIEIELLDFIFKNNDNVFLLSCGTDYVNVKYAFEKHLKYSILSPYFKKKITHKQAFPILNYIEPEHKRVHDFLYENIKGVIASDLDYHIPLVGHNRYLGLIPNPINTDSLRVADLKLSEKIVIFHGINRENYYKKGHDIFEEVLKLIRMEYPDKIEVISVESLPYKEYIKSYSRAHILLDQVYSYDQGYNALEAMAKGKVVFTGAESEWMEYYNIEEDSIVINTKPDIQYIFEKLKWLILNPEKITSISKNARKFVENEHHYVQIANKYVEVWKSVN